MDQVIGRCGPYLMPLKYPLYSPPSRHMEYLALLSVYTREADPVHHHPRTGHLGPLVPFARACVRAGHEVLVAAAPPVAPLADGAELPFRTLPEPPEDELAAVWEPVFSMPPERRDEHVIHEIFAGCHARAAPPGTLTTIEEWGPDVVRESCEFSAAIATERLGVPHASRDDRQLARPRRAGPLGAVGARGAVGTAAL
jgi:hypothetical protein